MSSISGVGSTWLEQAAQSPYQFQPASFQQVLQPVASLLGTTTQNLQSELKSGQTLSQIAGQQGVAQTDLVNAIEQGLQSAAPQNGSQPQGTQGTGQPDLTTIATNIANGTAPAGGHHHHHMWAAGASGSGGGGDDGSGNGDGDGSSSPGGTLGSLASLLGIDPSTLLDSLSSGTSLSDLASTQGVSASQLESFFASGMQVDTTA